MADIMSKKTCVRLNFLHRKSDKTDKFIKSVIFQNFDNIVRKKEKYIFFSIDFYTLILQS